MITFQPWRSIPRQSLAQLSYLSVVAGWLGGIAVSQLAIPHHSFLPVYVLAGIAIGAVMSPLWASVADALGSRWAFSTIIAFYLATMPLMARFPDNIPLTLSWWAIATLPVWYQVRAGQHVIGQLNRASQAALWLAAGFLILLFASLVHGSQANLAYFNSAVAIGLMAWTRWIPLASHMPLRSNSSPPRPYFLGILGGTLMILALSMATYLFLPNHWSGFLLAIILASLCGAAVLYWCPPSFWRNAHYMGISVLGIAVAARSLITPPTGAILLALAGILMAGWCRNQIRTIQISRAIPNMASIRFGLVIFVAAVAFAISSHLAVRTALLLTYVAIFLAWPLAKFIELNNDEPPVPQQAERTPEIWLGQFPLTPQERRISLMLLDGYSNQEIIGELYISINTLKTHLRNIYRKVEVKNRRDLQAQFAPRTTRKPYNYTPKSG